MKTKSSVREINGVKSVNKRDFSKKFGPRGKGNPNGIWQFRSDNSQTVVNEAGETVPLKTGVVVCRDQMEVADPAKQPIIEAIFEEKIAKIPTHRPIIVTKRSPNGSPLQGHTPTKKTKMYRRNTSKLITFMTNAPSSPTSETILPEIKESSLEAEEFKSMPPVTGPTKKRSFKVKKRKSRGSKKRKRSQNNVMGGVSATRYARAVGLISSPLKKKQKNKQTIASCEWTHLERYAQAGEEGQKPDNMVGALSVLNTDMMNKENGSQILANRFNEVTVEVEAALMGKTHLASSIDYSIHHEFFSLRYHIGYKRKAPHVTEKPYDESLIQAVGDAHRSPLSKKPMLSKASCFYSKKKAVAEMAGIKKKLSF
jgi:hypothetical protein